eukprot:GFKZ01015656.1.p1 GENE.GFKZ01015656.1~~GFKZ01015656.1.p1  ORF type:complete len:1532 (+),score=238.87 GFKZ01015656.1:595-5190(+)
MGVENRPSRSCTRRTLNRMSSTKDLCEDDVSPPTTPYTRLHLRRERPSRSMREASSDEELIEPDIYETAQEPPQPAIEHDPAQFKQYNAKHSQQSDDDSHQHDDLEIDNEEVHLDTRIYGRNQQPSPAPGDRVTRSGRIVKPPQQALPQSPLPTRGRRASSHHETPETREARVERRRRKKEEDLEYPYNPETRTRTTPRKAKPTYSFTEMDDDNFDDEDEMVIHRKNTRSRNFKIDQLEPGDTHRRATRRKSSSLAGHPDLTYNATGTQQQSPDRMQRPKRQTRSQTRYATRSRMSDGEADADVDGDGDFPSPGPGEDSAEQEIEDEIFREDQEAAHEDDHDDESDFDALHIAPKRSSRRARKTQPRRTVPAKRKRRSTRAERNESSIAREARKSYRPRSESLRPSDFYPDAGSESDDSVSSGGLAPAAKRSRPTRAAASRAEDAIANKLVPVDYLQNPMATMDAALSTRQPRSGRYSRRKSRLRPTVTDPFPSDDDAIVGSAMTTGIEPIQVDTNLSWEDVGGLDHHVRALKEMVALPLLYPEVFEKFKMEAPKGVLFYGPPGTGKTLCARALAASCGSEAIDMKSSPGVFEKSKNQTAKDSGIVSPLNTAPVSSNAVDPEAKSVVRVKEEPDVDVIMTDQPPKEPSAVEPNGPLIEKMGNVRVAPANGASAAFDVPGPTLLANEHAAVVSKRSEELHGRLAITKEEAKLAQKEVGGSLASSAPGGNQNTKRKSRVAFFMRNGADCLSKWVGEAERQLRMTFEAARKHQPSIIFFDEIDGLAPVRSSRQDQIHSSIVSTLLGLMDGLDARGQVVVIGATNRVDAIDPALRRPGRFDRELIFTLPNAQARRKILSIHTAKWSPPLSPVVLDAVAKVTVGYCGADLKSLCTESALRALRRRYPQIYDSTEKLLINPDEIKVTTKDFFSAMKQIVPASHRSARTNARPVPDRLGAILNAPLKSCMTILRRIFPQGLGSTDQGEPKTDGSVDGDQQSRAIPLDISNDDNSSSEEDDELSSLQKGLPDISNAGRLRPNGGSRLERCIALRPRLLICGVQGLGQAQLGPAILHNYESCPVHAIDYPTLHADAGSRCAEEALMSAFREAIRSVPSILYLPHLQLWWESASESLKTTLVIALKDVPPDLPLLVLATAEKPLNDLPQEVAEFFGETIELSAPPEEARRQMFGPLLDQAQEIPRMSSSVARMRRKRRKTEVLPKAPPPPPKPPTAEEKMLKVLAEDRFIRRLRMDMRAFVENLLRDRRFKAFWNPVDPLSAPDYYDIIKTPMDISKIASHIDLGKYPTVLAMVNDFEILVRNAIQYNPPNTETGAAILRRAHGLIDIVHAWVDNLNPVLVETCNKIIAERVEKSKIDIRKGEADEVDGGTKVAENREDVAQADDGGEKSEEDEGDEDEGDNEDVVGRVAGKEPVRGVKPSRCDMEINGGPEKTNERDDEEGRSGEEVVPASRSDLMMLKKQVLAISTGVTVDGLEVLYIKCAKLLRRYRHSMDRNQVTKRMLETVAEARNDPAVVGQLVE